MRLSKVVVSSSILVLMLCSILIVGCNSNNGNSSSSSISSSSSKFKDEHDVPKEIKDQISKTVEAKKMSGQNDMFDIVLIEIEKLDKMSNVRYLVKASYKVKAKKSPEELIKIIANDLTECKKSKGKDRKKCFENVYEKYKYALNTFAAFSIFEGNVKTDDIKKFIVGEELTGFTDGIWLKTEKGWDLTDEKVGI